MKKTYTIAAYSALILASFAFIAVIPVSLHAQEVDPATSVQLRNTLRARTEHIENNEAIRAKLLENRLIASSSRPEMKSELRPGMRTDLQLKASSTRPENARLENAQRMLMMKYASTSMQRREILNDLHLDVFNLRKNALVKQLKVSLDNLKQISERISTRIEKVAAEGTDVTEAQKLLIVALDKISTAGDAIETLSSYTPTQIELTASSTVKLEKPRQVGQTAIEAVKVAHQALVAVIKTLATNK